MEVEQSALESRYRAKIDPVLDKLIDYAKQNKPMSVAQQTRAQEVLDKIANTFQTHEELGEELYKLYLAQSLLQYYAGDHGKSAAFLAEAKKYANNGDIKFMDYLLGQNPENAPNSQPNIDESLAAAKKDAVKTTWKGVGLIAASLIITIISYNMADDGDDFFVFWGVGVWGLIVLFIGLYAYVNPVSKIDKEVAKQYPNLSRKGMGVLIGLIGSVIAVVLSFAAIAIFSPSLSRDLEGYTVENYQLGFTEGCLEGGGSTSECSCMATYMTDHYTLTRLQELDAAFDENAPLPSEVNAAVEACTN